jgi:hypothetical protein
MKTGNNIIETLPIWTLANQPIGPATTPPST